MAWSPPALERRKWFVEQTRDYATNLFPPHPRRHREADVTLTDHDFSLLLCNTGLTVADLALPISDVGLPAHETGLPTGNPALEHQNQKRRYTDNLGNVIILVIGGAAAFIALFELFAWMEYRRMSSGKPVGVVGLKDTKCDQCDQENNRQDDSDNL